MSSKRTIHATPKTEEIRRELDRYARIKGYRSTGDFLIVSALKATVQYPLSAAQIARDDAEHGVPAKDARGVHPEGFWGK